MLDSYADVERALSRYNDVVRPCGGSVVTVTRGTPSLDRFPAALFDDLEVRAELKSRMSYLDARSRYVLVRWYIEGAQGSAIARGLCCSSRHVHRLRSAAVESLVALGSDDAFADADVTEFL